jgi:hypothetical protein
MSILLFRICKSWIEDCLSHGNGVDVSWERGDVLSIYVVWSERETREIFYFRNCRSSPSDLNTFVNQRSECIRYSVQQYSSQMRLDKSTEVTGDSHRIQMKR